jgi:hypothetical protein
LFQEEGHVLPMHKTGNSHSEREVNEIDLVNLALSSDWYSPRPT